jgi:hypothetical protein
VVRVCGGRKGRIGSASSPVGRVLGSCCGWLVPSMLEAEVAGYAELWLGVVPRGIVESASKKMARRLHRKQEDGRMPSVVLQMARG